MRPLYRSSAERKEAGSAIYNLIDLYALRKTISHCKPTKEAPFCGPPVEQKNMEPPYVGCYIRYEKCSIARQIPG